jgi:hypothetical protein
MHKRSGLMAPLRIRTYRSSHTTQTNQDVLDSLH